MEFKQGLHLGTRLEQRLVMTQQLQQAIRLLQLSRTELVETIAETLNENPMLEEAPSRSDQSGSTSVTGGEGQVTTLDASESREKTSHEIDWQEFFADMARGPTAGPTGYASRDEELPPLSATLTREASLAEELAEQLGLMGLDERQRAMAEEIIGNLDDDGYFRPARLEMRGGTDAGRRLLRRKAELAGIEVADVEGGLNLLWLTDAEMTEWSREAEGRGLRATVEPGASLRALALRFQVAPAAAAAVLEAVQRCEPAGVAARDTRECLLLQARARFPQELGLHRLIDRHLENLEARKQGPIVRDLRVDETEVRRLLGLLRTLEPRPGRRYGGESAAYITPDVHVHKVGDDYKVSVNDDGLPRLRVSDFYRRALELASADPGQKGDPRADSDREAKAYMQEKLRQAEWMIRSIYQRQSTIQRVTDSIMRFQRPFLERGVSALRPLVLREVAEDVGLHESTISRVTTAKYVDTPQGIFELKYFFNSRISAGGHAGHGHGHSGHGGRGGLASSATSSGDMASEAVKHAIKRLIDKEPSKSPLSDQEIVEILQGNWDRAQLLSRLDCDEAEASSLLPEKSMSIARRTVAKYREAMHIPSSSGRRALI